MVQFTTTILRFAEQGEKTGWSYIAVPAKLAEQLKPGNKKTFRVKGKIDAHIIVGVALLPMGDGDFIMPVNAAMRKAIKKRNGDAVALQLQVDTKEMKPPPELVECFNDEPKAGDYFKTLPRSHQNYFTKWITDAKTEQTKTKRIAQAVNALAKGLHFGKMLQALKKEKDELM